MELRRYPVTITLAGTVVGLTLGSLLGNKIAERKGTARHSPWVARQVALDGTYRAFCESAAGFADNPNPATLAAAEESFRSHYQKLSDCMPYMMPGEREDSLAILSEASRRVHEIYPRCGMFVRDPGKDYDAKFGWRLRVLEKAGRSYQATGGGFKLPDHSGASPNPEPPR